MTRSRPESRLEVDEAPRSSGRFNLDRVAQEHMNEGLETCTPPEPVPSMRNLEANRISWLMGIALPGLTPCSTCGSQSGTRTSRLRELQERLRAKALENAAREQQPTTWREHPVRSVVISSYKKTLTACTTNLVERTGRQRNEREEMPFMTPRGQSTSYNREHPKAQFT